jgi:glycosyltransferase involved in cell wall biosynthesis
MKPILYRQLKIAVINSTLDEPYHSYGDHWVDGFKDAGCDVDVYKYDTIPTLPLKYDLYFFVEVRYNPESIPWYVYPRVLYSWDSHIMGVELYKILSKHFNMIFLASKIDVDALNYAGVENIIWIPEACNVQLHRDLDIPRIYDIGLVGRQNDTIKRNGYTKTDFINFLINSKYKNFFKTEIWGESYVSLMNQTTIAFDRTVKHNIGTRIFESAAMGCVPLWSESGISNTNGMSTLMEPWVHYVPYMDTIESLSEVINFLLSHPDKIAEIRTKAKEHVCSNHTYAHRAKDVLRRSGISYCSEDEC